MPPRINAQSARLGLVLCLLAGCTYTAHGPGPSPGSLTLHVPGRVTPQPAPPPAAIGTAGVVPAPVDGHYAGTGRLLSNPGARAACRATIPVTGFVVAGNRVSYGGGRGTIQADGSLRMQVGHRVLSGQFSGPRFEGRYWLPPPACSYWLTLDPVP